LSSELTQVTILLLCTYFK